MSHLALRPEALAIASNLFRSSLRYMNKGILVSLTGNFCGYPKAPSTPLVIAGNLKFPVWSTFNSRALYPISRHHQVGDTISGESN